MRQCIPCNRLDLLDTDDTCPTCHAATTRALAPEAPAPSIWAVLLGAAAIAGAGYVAHRLGKSISTSPGMLDGIVSRSGGQDLPGGANAAVRMGNAIQDAQVRTWAAGEWSKVYRP